MAVEMGSGSEDEEMIQAFKMFGPSSEYDGITLRMLTETLEREGEVMKEEEAAFLFDYVDID